MHDIVHVLNLLSAVQIAWSRQLQLVKLGLVAPLGGHVWTAVDHAILVIYDLWVFGKFAFSLSLHSFRISAWCVAFDI
jgi:hypothetical protein